MDDTRLEEALCGLRGWRSAGNSHANRGGSLMTLDSMVDVAMDEIEWRKDPEGAQEDEVERPDESQLSWALNGMEKYFHDGSLGEDLQIIHQYLSEPALFPAQEMTG